ncbi:MAG TPA: AMP-binding protein [Gaiellales bacterium]|jgi:acetyl-CoA synthetase|nr:AMP-binding protein [Gaiellales bacterium]
MGAADIVWSPTPEVVERARITALCRELEIDDWRELHRRSTEDIGWFWDAVVRHLGIEFFSPYERVYDESAGVEWTTWFGGGTVNLTHNCVDRHARGSTGSRPAAIWESEDGTVETVTYAELSAEVNRIANCLLELGVKPGDAVGLYLPMSIRVVAGFYAICKIGAIVVPVFSGFAAPAVAARLADAGAVALLTADAVPRKGRPVSMKAIADDALRDAPGVRHVIVWNRLGSDPPMTAGRDHWWHEAVDGRPAALQCPALDPETPMMIIYTSGTTGRPKGAVHVHGGFLVKIAEECAFQTDVGADDRFMWVSDMGWIMGPKQVVGAGALGATLVLSEGAPDHPGPGRLWELVERHRISVLGVSPTLIRALRGHGDEPVLAHDRSSLRILASTGEPWNPEPYRWLHEVCGEGRCPIINLSGGTEVAACFLSPMPVMPLKECTLGMPSLGMAMDVAGPDGEHLPAGEVGELVCKKPWPSMTRGVWGDPERYLQSYWSRWPGVWVHGDWASVDKDGYWYLHGRSDDTLNVAGKRIGPAEFESAAVSHPAVSEACAIGVPDEVKGEVVWVYCVLAPGAEPTEELRDQIRARVAEELGKAFAPARVLFTDGLPRTRSAKIVRRAVRAAALGEEQGDLSSLDDPTALERIAAAR